MTTEPGADLDLGPVADAIRRSPATNGIRLVGIDGGAGSGKSTLARRLGEQLGAPVVGLDWFMVWHDLNSWWPRVESELIEPLLRGEDARYRLRDWVGDEFGESLGDWAEQPWAPIVLLEGVTSTRRAVADRLSFRIWVEAPEELRMSRGLARDGETHRPQWENWLRMEREFFAADRAIERADLVVTTS